MRLRSFPPSRWLRAALLACGLALALPVLADEYADVQKLQRDGKTAEALERADKYIEAHPGDPQMRFIKANLLSASQRAGEAEQLLRQMTRDTPELAEPWNNLAVLHAAQGDLDQALEELKTALRLNPAYATALENLGDVQVRLATLAYQRAHQLDGNNQRLPPKIEALSHALAAPVSAVSSPTAAASSPAAASAAASSPASAVSSPAAAASSPTAAASAPASVASSPAAPASAPVSAASSPASAPQPAGGDQWNWSRGSPESAGSVPTR